MTAYSQQNVLISLTKVYCILAGYPASLGREGGREREGSREGEGGRGGRVGRVGGEGGREGKEGMEGEREGGGLGRRGSSKARVPSLLRMSAISTRMCAKFGCGPTVVSEKGGGYRQTEGNCSFI